jgi:hypothetical protein
MCNPNEWMKSLLWRTSSSCYNANCVQVAVVGNAVAVRDSKNPDGSVLWYDEPAWRDFLKGVEAGEFDA